MNDSAAKDQLVIHEKFYNVMRLAQKLEKTPRKFGTDELLTGSEIHLIEFIGDFDEALSVTDLAGASGVTKGAVSQHLKKLGQRGFINKRTDPENSSRTIVKLTAKGKVAYYAHQHWHETMDGGFKAYFTNLSQDKLDFLIEFLTRFETFMTKRLAADL